MDALINVHVGLYLIYRSINIVTCLRISIVNSERPYLTLFFKKIVTIQKNSSKLQHGKQLQPDYLQLFALGDPGNNLFVLSCRFKQRVGRLKMRNLLWGLPHIFFD